MSASPVGASPTGPVEPPTYDTVSKMRFSVLVEVRLRPGVADPQGATIERALPMLGFEAVRDVTVGKAIRFDLDAADEGAAREEVDDLCAKFLTNPVIEDAVVSMERAS